MDAPEAWSKIDADSKATRRISERITTVLDGAAPFAAPLAVRWDAEAKRRSDLRTPEHLKALMDAQRAHNSARTQARTARAQRSLAKKNSRNPLSAERRAAKVADRAASKHAEGTRDKLKAARKQYPAPLARIATQLHAVHAVPSVAISGWLSGQEALTVWPTATSLSVIAAQVGALWLGRRAPKAAAPADDFTAEERRLAERLDPSYWAQHAEERGLAGAVPAPVELTPAGLVSHVRLDGRWKPSAFKAKHEEIRALLGARTDLRMEIKAGSHGDRATVTLRTRSAADGVELTGWTPGSAWGVDTVTGDPVMVPLGRRMLIAGTSGSGKSWSTRALLAEASERDDHRLAVVDPKRVEAINWQHRARTAIRAEDLLDLSDELVEEMHERLELVPRGRDTIEISANHPRITVFVDEGAEVIAMSRKTRAKGTEDDPGDPDWSRILENFRTLARMGRAAEIILIWATQKPTMDKNGGIDPQISAQITYRAALALATSGESRVVFGEDATERGWHAHDLPMPGVAMLKAGPKSTPTPIRTRAFSPADVIALPERSIWHRGDHASAPEPQATARPALKLVKDEPEPDYEIAPPAEVPAPREESTATNRDRVFAAIREGATTPKAVAAETGLNKGTVSREVKQLVAAGAVLRAEDGSLTATAGEVSA